TALLAVPQQSYTSTSRTFEIPRALGSSAFIVVQTDTSDAVNEFPQENNNSFAYAIHVTPAPRADLATADVIAPVQSFDDSEIEVRFTVTNRGTGKTDRDAWTDTVWLVNDRKRPDARTGDMLLTSVNHTGALEVGDSYEQIVVVKVPRGL